MLNDDAEKSIKKDYNSSLSYITAVEEELWTDAHSESWKANWKSNFLFLIFYHLYRQRKKKTLVTLILIIDIYFDKLDITFN